jgi:hypothetical protein
MDIQVVGRMLGNKEGRSAYENAMEIVSYVISFGAFYVFVYIAKVRPSCLTFAASVLLLAASIFAFLLPFFNARCSMSHAHLHLPERAACGHVLCTIVSSGGKQGSIQGAPGSIVLPRCDCCRISHQ